MVSIDTLGCRLRNSGAQTSRPETYITSGFSGRWPIGWLNTAATTRSGARSISFSANEPPIQLPKKTNWRMPRWSISPNWSSAKAPHGSSTGIGPVDNPWGAFADDQLGLMDHLGIRQFVFFGNCIGGSFALKLMERAP